ncbi:MAG: Hsp20/alpha crystallin family protein [Caulobacterales bacterium]
MAEPQANTQQSNNQDQARGREGAAAPAGAGEGRSFEPQTAARGPGQAIQGAGEVAHPLAAGAQQVAEAGRLAGLTASGAWRQAFDPFLAMQLDMTRLFDALWKQTTGLGATGALHTGRPFAGFGPAQVFGMPPADLKETDQAHILAIELPGLTREDVEIAIEGDALTVKGHKAESAEANAGAYRVSERRFGRFERAFPLPADVDRQAITAELKDGLLQIVLPKTLGAAPPRSRIEITG